MLSSTACLFLITSFVCVSLSGVFRLSLSLSCLSLSLVSLSLLSLSLLSLSLYSPRDLACYYNFDLNAFVRAFFARVACEYKNEAKRV